MAFTIAVNGMTLAVDVFAAAVGDRREGDPS
jgi:hypothetical protein